MCKKLRGTCFDVIKNEGVSQPHHGLIFSGFLFLCFFYSLLEGIFFVILALLVGHSGDDAQKEGDEDGEDFA